MMQPSVVQERKKQSRRATTVAKSITICALSIVGSGHALAITGSITPSNATVGVTNVFLVGTASPGATITDTETGPDLVVRTYTTAADTSGNYSFGPFIIPELGTYTDALSDSISGASQTITYSGNGDFSATSNTAFQSIVAGQQASWRRRQRLWHQRRRPDLYLQRLQFFLD